MRIAIPYENGEIFQHFGHTKQFKIYDVREGKVQGTDLLDAEGHGHEALAKLLGEQAIDLVICGGIGAGAEAALKEETIVLCSGAEGSADEAVLAFLRGELMNAGVTCDHHHEEESGAGCGAGSEHAADDAEDSACGCGEGCGDSCGDSCGSGCGGCSGCGSRPVITGRNVGKRCKAHYRGTFNDGTVFDSSYDRGEPLEFICGVGQMILGFDKAVAEMEAGETRQIHLMPEEAYGEADPEAVFAVELKSLPGAERLDVGQLVMLTNYYGQPFRARVAAKDEKTITFDANHEMAGKELNFLIELVEVSDPE